MAPEYAVLFDFPPQAVNVTRDLLVIFGLSVVGTLLLFVTDSPSGQKAATALLMVAFLGVMLFNTVKYKMRHSAIAQAARANELTVVEGFVERERSVGGYTYSVGVHDLDVSNRYPAFDADDQWMSENLVRRCARMRITTHGDIVWVGLRREGCSPTDPDLARP